MLDKIQLKRIMFSLDNITNIPPRIVWDPSTSTVRHQHVAISKKTMALIFSLLRSLKMRCLSFLRSFNRSCFFFQCNCNINNIHKTKKDKFNVLVLGWLYAPSNWKICMQQMGKNYEKNTARATVATT